VEHYTQHHLLLHTDALALRSVEAEAHRNTLQAFSKQCLAKSSVLKSLLYDLQGSIYNKGWGDP